MSCCVAGASLPGAGGGGVKPGRAPAGGGGSGLGLPTARAIAESHGGVLELASVLGQGTEAVLRLPRTEPGSG